MGQVISLPTKQVKQKAARERRAAFITGLCALTYLLGFFIVGPSLAMFAFGFTTAGHASSALMCVGGLLVTWALTRVAYKRL